MKNALKQRPGYEERAEVAHKRLNKSKCYRKFREVVLDHMKGQESPEQFVETALDSFDALLLSEGFRLNTTFSNQTQKRIAQDMFISLNTPACAGNMNFLYDHTYWHQIQDLNSKEIPASYSDDIRKAFELMEEIADRRNTDCGAIFIKMKQCGLSTVIAERLMDSMIEELVMLPYAELLMREFGNKELAVAYSQIIETREPNPSGIFTEPTDIGKQHRYILREIELGKW